MLRHIAAEPTPAGREIGCQSDRLGGAIASANTSKPQELATPIRATLIGCDRCEVEGYAVRAYAPLPAMCRELVAAGYDPATPLEAYRGDMLCLKARSIGEGANLEINGDGVGLRQHRKPDAASPIAANASGVSR
jgi:hypothetical protein